MHTDMVVTPLRILMNMCILEIVLVVQCFQCGRHLRDQAKLEWYSNTGYDTEFGLSGSISAGGMGYTTVKVYTYSRVIHQSLLASLGSKLAVAGDMPA